jgi:hypothetical protein
MDPRGRAGANSVPEGLAPNSLKVFSSVSNRLIRISFSRLVVRRTETTSI